MKITNRFYFTISDNNDLNKYPFRAKTLHMTFRDWFTSWGYELPQSFDFDAKTTTLLQDYIWPRFYDECFFYVDADEEPEYSEQAAAVLKKLGCIYAWLIESQKTYGKLLDLYQTQENDLMKQLSSKSTTLFNDTPQSGGDVTTASYITNATTATTNADVGTPMARLKEIRDNIEDLYGAWSNEFRKFIIWR